MIVAFPSDYSDQIDQIRNTYGRNITINIPVSGIACTEPGCDLDPVTGFSTDQFCDVCEGDYWLNTVSGYLVKARILYKGVGTPLWNPQGFVPDGDVQVRIAHSDTHLGYVETAETFEVDDKTYILKDYDLRGIPDPNRIVVALVQKE